MSASVLFLFLSILTIVRAVHYHEHSNNVNNNHHHHHCPNHPRHSFSSSSSSSERLAFVVPRGGGDSSSSYHSQLSIARATFQAQAVQLQVLLDRTTNFTNQTTVARRGLEWHVTRLSLPLRVLPPGLLTEPFRRYCDELRELKEATEPLHDAIVEYSSRLRDCLACTRRAVDRLTNRRFSSSSSGSKPSSSPSSPSPRQQRRLGTEIAALQRDADRSRLRCDRAWAEFVRQAELVQSKARVIDAKVKAMRKRQQPPSQEDPFSPQCKDLYVVNVDTTTTTTNNNDDDDDDDTANDYSIGEQTEDVDSDHEEEGDNDNNNVMVEVTTYQFNTY